VVRVDAEELVEAALTAGVGCVGPELSVEAEVQALQYPLEAVGQRAVRQPLVTGVETRSVLGRLDRDGPATATILARAEGLRPQSMGTIVAALEAAGLVAGSPDPKDGRKTILSLTQTAREQFRTGRLAREDWLIQAMSAALTPSELDQLSPSIDLLRRIARS
jgi:DNA-binding MarR family transcriptional regulator